jgi:hypothetical protein
MEPLESGDSSFAAMTGRNGAAVYSSGLAESRVILTVKT